MCLPLVNISLGFSNKITSKILIAKESIKREPRIFRALLETKLTQD